MSRNVDLPSLGVLDLPQHRLLLAVTGRLLDADAGRCLYDGALLDEMLHQLDLAVRDPARLVDKYCVHTVNERMRRFMDHFEKVRYRLLQNAQKK